MRTCFMWFFRLFAGLFKQKVPKAPKFTGLGKEIMIISEDEIPTVRPPNRIPPIPMMRAKHREKRFR